MPVFSRARESARKIVCNSQLHQLGLAINLYTQDYDECYPVAYGLWTNPGSCPWEPSLWTALHQSYVKNLQVWWCPSWRGVYGENAFGGCNNQRGSYDFIHPETATDMTVQEVIGSPIRTPVSAWSEASLTDPSSYPLLFCGVQVASTQGYINAHTGANDTGFYAGSKLGGTNVMYADQHVKWAVVDVGRWQTLYRTTR